MLNSNNTSSGDVPTKQLSKIKKPESKVQVFLKLSL